MNSFTNFFGKRNGNETETMLPETVRPVVTIECETGNMNQLGYMRAGRNNGDPAALSNCFQLIKSGQIVDENNNEQKRREAIEDLEKKICEHRDEKSKIKPGIEKIDQVEIPAIQQEIDSSKHKIDQLRHSSLEKKYTRNRFNLVLTWTGFIFGFIYLYLFYVSAIHSALFRNIAGEVANADQDSIGILLNNVFNITAFREFNIHWFAPIVFFIFALILHFAFEIKNKAARWVSIVSVIAFVLIADGLIAYSIENNNHTISKLMGLSDGEWVFYKSFVFYMVFFFGFFTSMSWSLVLHRLATEFNSANPEREAEDEILFIEKRLKQLYAEKGNAGMSRIEKVNAIASLEDKIKNLEERKNNVHYSLVDLEKNIDDFYNGWLSYLNGLRTDLQRKQECQRVYVSFKSEYFNRSLTA
jgi:hypothetical protein